MNYEAPLMPDWVRLHPAKFETIVTAVLRRHHPDGFRPDGSGGDRGRDFVVPGAGGEIVYQIKQLDRLHAASRRHIKESIKAVAGSSLRGWLLVAPIDPTLKEMEWFLEATSVLGIPCQWYGRNWLDTEMPKHLDVLLAHLGNVGSIKARVHDELRAVGNPVVDLNDVIQAQQRLNSVADLLHPDFSVEVRAGGDGPSLRISPKSGGPLRVDLASIQRHAGAEAADLIRFGVPFRFEAPGQLFGLPSELGGEELMGWLVQGSKGPPTEVAWQAVNGRGRVVGELRFVQVQPSLGWEGAQLDCVDASGWLAIRLRLLVPGTHAQLNLHVDTDTRSFPDDLLPLCDFSAACAGAVSLCISLRIDGNEHRLQPAPMPAFMADLVPPPMAQYVRDLVRLQRHSGVRSAVSLHDPDNDPRMVRDLIRGIDGDAVEIKGVVTATLTHVDDDVLHNFTEGCAMVIDEVLESLVMQGTDYPLGLDRRVACPKVVVEDAEALRRAHAFGGECEVRLRPADDGAWTVLLGESEGVTT